MSRGTWVRGVLVAAVVAALAAACSPEKMLLPNRPPETTLFVQGPIDTVNHVVHLYWFGSDPDGTILDFEIRFSYPGAPADSGWVATSRRDAGGRLELLTDSLFTVFTPNGVIDTLFEVRAIDNEGERDPTPARQSFTFSNQPPTVTIVSAPGTNDTTFASATLTWIAGDIDGDLNKTIYHVWLDGNEANPAIATTTTFTVPTEQFLENGKVVSRRRSVHIQAIDDGGMAGNIDSTSWNVLATVPGTSPGTRARLLVIDDVPNTNPANTITDRYYAAAAGDNLPDGDYRIIRLQTNQPFRSAKDVEQTFALYEAVIWYRGTQTSFSTLLRDYQGGIGAYVDGGGAFFIEGLDLTDNLGRFGPFTREFASTYLGTDFFFKYFSQALGDSTSGWGNKNGSIFHSTMFQDSLRTALLPAPGLRAFAVRDTHDVALWALPGQLSPANAVPYAVGVSVTQPSGGKLIALTLPLVASNAYQSVPRFLTTVLDSLRITGP